MRTDAAVRYQKRCARSYLIAPAIVHPVVLMRVACVCLTILCGLLVRRPLLVVRLLSLRRRLLAVLLMLSRRLLRLRGSLLPILLL